MKHSPEHLEEMDETKQPIDVSGEIEIEWTHVVRDYFKNGLADLHMKATIYYRLWSVDTDSVDGEYKFIGSVNYLPSDFEQLIRDYLYELPEMKNQRINKLTKI